MPAYPEMWAPVGRTKRQRVNATGIPKDRPAVEVMGLRRRYGCLGRIGARVYCRGQEGR